MYITYSCYPFFPIKNPREHFVKGWDHIIAVVVVGIHFSLLEIVLGKSSKVVCNVVGWEEKVGTVISYWAQCMWLVLHQLIKQISQDPGLLLWVMFSLYIVLLHFFMFFISFAMHQKSGMGFTLAWYPMFLLSLPLMFSVDSEIWGQTLVV